MISSTKKTYAKIIAISFAIIVLLFALMPKIEVGKFPKQKNSSFVYVVPDSDSTTNIGIEQINDFAPMFIPTHWNSSLEKQDIQKTSTWEVSIDNPNAKVAVNNTSLQQDILKLENKKTLRRKQFDVVMRSAFLSYGTAQQQTAPTENVLVLEIKNLNTGKIAFSKKIQKSEIGNFINIAEFSISVSDGIMQMPLLKSSSGDINIDKKLRGVILQNHTSVPNGEYRAVFIP